jgi:Peptide methionine sulfoxide reductase
MSEERAVLAGGCFWGMQDLIRRYEGVISRASAIPAATLRMRPTAIMEPTPKPLRSSSIPARSATARETFGQKRRRRSEGERRGISRIGRGSPTGSENMCVKSISAPVQVSRTPASRNHPRAPTTGVREAPRHEIAGRKGLGFAAAIYGDLRRASVCFRKAGTTDTLDFDGLICRGERAPPGLG